MYSSPTFSPDGEFVAALSSAPDNPAVVVWDVASGRRDSPRAVPDGASRSRSIPTDGHSSSPEFEGIGSTPLMTDTRSSRCPHPGSSPTGSFRPDGHQARDQVPDLAWGPGAGPRHREPPATIDVGDVVVVDWSPDGERLAIGSGNQGPVRVVDVSPGRTSWCCVGTIEWGGRVAFVSDDRLASVGGDLRVWNVSAAVPPSWGRAIHGGRSGCRGFPGGLWRWRRSTDRREAVEFFSTDTGRTPPSAHRSVRTLRTRISPD